MTFEKYINETKDNIKNYLPSEFQNEDVIISDKYKNNGVKRHGLSIKNQESNVAPTIYLEDYYQLYQEGMTAEETWKECGNVFINAMQMPPKLDLKDFAYDNIRDKLFLCAVNYEKNKELLDHIPHNRMENLAMVYRFEMKSNEIGSGSVLIHNDLFDNWGIDMETLHEQAESNMKKIRPPEFHSMNYVIAEGMGMPFEETEEMMEQTDLFVLTNPEKNFGASYMFCPDVLQSISDKLQGNLVILPSSVHEGATR